MNLRDGLNIEAIRQKSLNMEYRDPRVVAELCEYALKLEEIHKDMYMALQATKDYLELAGVGRGIYNLVCDALAKAEGKEE